MGKDDKTTQTVQPPVTNGHSALPAEPKPVKQVKIQELTHFKDPVNQVYFEFIYLVALLAIASVLLLLLYNGSPLFNWADNKSYFYSIIAAFLGGWTYDAKWFYLSTSMGKSNEFEAFKWSPNKFYWRMLIPFISAILGFSFYILVKANLIPFMTLGNSNIQAFGFSFAFGYFSEVTVEKIASWVKKPADNKANTDDTVIVKPEKTDDKKINDNNKS